jgi:RNA polymerase sigma factor (sigma-70 family)
MKIANPDPDLLQEATAGDLAALDRLLRLLQPGVYNLALRMLGQRDDAADATQEILLKIVTHLGSFRGQAAFSTWVFQVARHHLLTAATRAREFPTVSFDAIAHKLGAGLELAVGLAGPQRMLTPEDKLAARQVALSCTQGMLMALDRPHRLAYVLDLLFDLDSQQAGEVPAITAAAYRQRPSRASPRGGFCATHLWPHQRRCRLPLRETTASDRARAAARPRTTAGHRGYRRCRAD